jgi:copper chaperone NosL
MRKSKPKKEKKFPQRRRDAKAKQSFFFAKSLRLSAFAWFFFLFDCGSSEIRPVDIYPEDMCSHCRMAISDQRFAAEIITVPGEVFKFDDLGCMERYQEKMSNLKTAAKFVKDYEQKIWLPVERSTIVRTSIKTPMSSGLVALADSSQAQEYLRRFPAGE